MGKFMGVTSPMGVWMKNRLLKFMMDYDIYLKFAEKEIINDSPVPVKDPRHT